MNPATLGACSPQNSYGLTLNLGMFETCDVSGKRAKLVRDHTSHSNFIFFTVQNHSRTYLRLLRSF